ncbi:MAG: hypothetical protein QOG38_3292 [Hyphomicrobiales bacterium]|nr:hypothetical protein [Hyphomicrobiales bacterium]
MLLCVKSPLSVKNPHLVRLDAYALTRDTYWGFGAPAPAADNRGAMTSEQEREFRAQLARLQQEHRDLDAAIEALQGSPGSDLLQVQRLKKRKLVLRDRMSFIEDQLTPDIIA